MSLVKTSRWKIGFSIVMLTALLCVSPNLASAACKNSYMANKPSALKVRAVRCPDQMIAGNTYVFKVRITSRKTLHNLRVTFWRDLKTQRFRSRIFVKGRVAYTWYKLKIPLSYTDPPGSVLEGAFQITARDARHISDKTEIYVDASKTNRIVCDWLY
jgi:hypothetical protein